MDWWRYNAQAEKEVDFFEANAHYWKTETDQVVALFISEYGRDDFFIRVHPDFLGLFSEVLKWGLEVWAGEKTQISTDVCTFGQQKIEQLMAADFYEDGHQENARIYNLEQYDFSYDLKPNFKMLSFSEYGNDESKVKLVQNSFGNPNFSAARIHSVQSSPTYQAELDLVIVNPQGESVGYCTGWIEEINPNLVTLSRWASIAITEEMALGQLWQKSGSAVFTLWGLEGLGLLLMQNRISAMFCMNL